MAKAFPSAYGFGTSSNVGGRGGDVLFVTNLNDSGAGSLRAALEASGPRIIIPKIGGIVELSSVIYVTDPYVSYFGQCAPADSGGLLVKNRGIRIANHDAIIRHLSVLPGPDALGSIATLPLLAIESTATATLNLYNITFDHCVGAWGTEQMMDAYGTWQDITFQWCLIAEGRVTGGTPSTPGFGSLFGNGSFAQFGVQRRISLHHNVWSLCKTRVPFCNLYHHDYGGVWQLDAMQVDFRNNLIYTWNGNGRSTFGRAFVDATRWNAFVAARGSGARVTMANVVGNHWIKGPTSASEEDAFTVGLNTQVYANNNIGPASTVTPVDGFNIKVSLLDKQYEGGTTTLRLHGTYTNTPYVSGTPFDFPTIEEHDATEIKALLTANAGRTKPAKDTTWQRMMDHVINGDGTYADHNDYPTLATGTYPTHSQPDGIPDSWKTANGLSTSVDYTGVQAPDGYDWVEKWSHEMAGEADTGLRIITPSTDPRLVWDLKTGATRNRVFVEWGGKKRWWEAPTDDTLGVNADGSGRMNAIDDGSLQLPSEALKFSIRQYDVSDNPLEDETEQIDWDNS